MVDGIGEAIGTVVYINLLLPVNLESQSGELAGNRFPRDSITLKVRLISQPVQYVLLEVLIQVAAAAIVSCPASVRAYSDWRPEHTSGIHYLSFESEWVAFTELVCDAIHRSTASI
jgi:hypothetical protein